MTSAAHPSPVLAALTSAMLLTACDGPARFSAPLSEPGSVAYDERLLGAWGVISGEGGEASAALLVVKRGEPGMLRVAYSLSLLDPWAEVGAVSLWYEWLVHPSEIDGEMYFNGRVAALNRFGGGLAGDPVSKHETDRAVLASEPVYEIGWVELKSVDLLTLSFLSEDAMIALEFTARVVPCGAECELTVYDLSSAQLRELIRSKGRDDLFETSTTFRRLSGPDPSQIGK